MLPTMWTPRDVPVDPDADQARDWLLRELAKGEYQAAKPTLLDMIAEAVLDWFRSLTAPAVPGGPPLLLLVVLVVVVALVVVAFVIYGRPRLQRRSRLAGELFGEADDRSAATIRSASEAAARAGDWPTAIAERFRAVARSLADRTVVMVTPGTTAHDVAERAGRVFPALSSRLDAGAASFDGVRYLDRAGSRAEYDDLVTLDRDLELARPDLAAAGSPDAAAALAGGSAPR